MKIGDYYWTDVMPEPDEAGKYYRLKFWIVFKHTQAGREYFLATKCFHNSYQPIITDGYQMPFWFNADGTMCPSDIFNGNDPAIRLVKKARRK